MKKDFSEIPANRLFNFTLISSSEKRAEISMPLEEDYLQEGSVAFVEKRKPKWAPYTG